MENACRGIGAVDNDKENDASNDYEQEYERECKCDAALLSQAIAKKTFVPSLMMPNMKEAENEEQDAGQDVSQCPLLPDRMGCAVSCQMQLYTCPRRCHADRYQQQVYHRLTAVIAPC